MTVYHDEVEIEDFEFDEEDDTYYYPCPCGDQFQITRADLIAGVDDATCPSCSLVVKVIYDKAIFISKQEELQLSDNKETAKEKA